MKKEEVLITLSEAGRLVGTSAGTVAGWVARGNVTAVTYGARRLVSAKDVKQYAADNLERNRALAASRFGDKQGRRPPPQETASGQPCGCAAHVARLESLVTRLEAVLGTSGGKLDARKQLQH